MPPFILALIGRFIPYKNLIIIGGILLILAGTFWAGWYECNAYHNRKTLENALETNQNYITETTKMERKNGENLAKRLDEIDNSQDADGPVSPLLFNVLERMR